MAMPPVPLSVLDLATVAEGSSASQALWETTELARAAEALGYHRLWVAEHHGMPSVASSAPAVLLAHLAASTTTLRLGSGGVMLPNHAPLVVAEQFGTLEALYPGRIDLGLGRAPGTDPRTAAALRRNDPEQFPDDVVELVGYFTGAGDQPLAVPGQGNLPELWMLGSSVFGAHLAGLLGLPYAFAYHFSPQYLEPALARYRAAFRPSPMCAEPRVLVAVSVLCAPSPEEAAWLSGPSALATVWLRTGRPAPLPSPEQAARYDYSPSERALVDSVRATQLIGDPAMVVEGLAALQARTGADELMVTTRVFDAEDRVRSFELVAEAWGALRGTDPA
ncbi:MAG TPA: LLM class flavin-dependent oxidoreductase [Acidimicrobiales bacterium]|nr:LLM class flavin-dependent oxidoreductase [Acidimicrobiales bacterium]